MKGSKYTTVSIPVELADDIREQIKDTGFKSLSDYVTYLLREIKAGRDEYETDEAKVKEKLRKLGYL